MWSTRSGSSANITEPDATSLFGVHTEGSFVTSFQLKGLGRQSFARRWFSTYRSVQPSSILLVQVFAHLICSMFPYASSIGLFTDTSSNVAIDPWPWKSKGTKPSNLCILEIVHGGWVDHIVCLWNHPLCFHHLPLLQKGYQKENVY